MAKWKNPNRQLFLLSFFDKDEYAEKEINGFVLVKYFSNNTHVWEVAIYTNDSFAKRKEYLENENRDREPNAPVLP